MGAMTLRVVAQPASGEPEAWLIPGADVQRWVGELIRWHELPANTAVAVLGQAGQSAVGVVVRTTLAPPAGTLAVPLRMSDGRLFLPRDAAITPPVTNSELQKLFPPGWIVWLPDTAPWVVPLDQVLTVAALIAVPDVMRGAWLAAPVVLPPVRLLEIRPADEVDLGPLFNAEHTGIAKDPLKDLPGRVGEPGALGVLGRQMIGGIGRAVGGMISGLGGGALGESIQRAFERFGGHLDPRVMEKRFEALHRLLDLLDRDPATGLQRALPLGGDDQQQPRGIARPGWQLGWRSLDFSLRPGGSGPIDPWILPEELRQQLRQRYLALAQQEADRGNHRRAAAIHAQLMNDWNAAAQVLERGGYYREAAAIFRERLKQPAEAARCFERGGMLVEAAHAYAELKQHIEAGRCWRRHGDEERARASFLLAVAACRGADDLVAAANIHVEHLHDIDGAITLLTPTWPDHPHASAALVLRTRLLIRLGRTPAIATLLHDLRTVPRERIVAAVPALHAVGIDHPDADLREEAEDVLRCLVGNANAEGPDAELIRAFVPFAARDRQVNEDAGRWLREAQRRLKALPAINRSLAGSGGFAVQLGADERPLNFVTLTNGVLVFAECGEGLLRICRFTWKGEALPTANFDGTFPHPRIRAFCLSGPTERVYAMAAGSHDGSGCTLPLVSFPTTDSWPLQVKIGTFGPIQSAMQEVAPDGQQGWWVMAIEDGYSLIHCAATGASRRTSYVIRPPDDEVHFAVGGNRCLISIDKELHFIHGGLEEVVAHTHLDDNIVQLVAVPEQKRQGQEPGIFLAVTRQQVVRVTLEYMTKIHCEVVADHLPQMPVLGFTCQGDLVVGVPQELRVYRAPFTSGIAMRVAIAGTPVTIAPSRHPDQILVLDTSGWLREVRLPKSDG